MQDVEKLDTIAAGADPVRLEAYGISLFGKKTEDFRAVELAEKRGLGTRDFRSTGFIEVNLG